jgi:hypothetical protein
MKLSIFTVFVSCVLLAGCATPYQQSGYLGGYSETQLTPDTFRVFFKGNQYTSEERAKDFTLLRAADITITNGFKYFAVMDSSYKEKIDTVTTGGSSYTSGTDNLYGSNGMYQGSYSSTTTYNPPQTEYISKPRSDLLFKCFADKPDNADIFDAEFLQKSLRQKYKLK